MKSVKIKNETYSIDELGQKQGRFTSFHPNENVYVDCFYKDNKLHGEYKVYWANGRVGRHCFYVDDIKFTFNDLDKLSDIDLHIFMLDHNLPLLPQKA